jgi:hypothetical protein
MKNGDSQRKADDGKNGNNTNWSIGGYTTGMHIWGAGTWRCGTRDNQKWMEKASDGHE